MREQTRHPCPQDKAQNQGKRRTIPPPPSTTVSLLKLEQIPTCGGQYWHVDPPTLKWRPQAFTGLELRLDSAFGAVEMVKRPDWGVLVLGAVRRRKRVVRGRMASMIGSFVADMGGERLDGCLLQDDASMKSV